MNKIAESIIGVRREKVFNQHAKVVLKEWENLTRNMDTKEIDFLGRTRIDGNEKYYNVRLSRVYDRSSQEIGSIITWRDITERKQMEEARRRSRDDIYILQQSIFDAANRSSNWRDFLTISLYQIVYSLKSQIGSIHICEEKYQSGYIQPSLICYQGLSTDEKMDFIDKLLKLNILTDVIRNQNTIMITANENHNPYTPILEQGIVSLVVVPLIYEDNLAGIITLGRKEGNKYSNEDLLRLKTISMQIAAFIQREQQRQLAIALLERRRLVRDLHDSITQRLLGQVVLTEAAQLGIKTGAIENSSKIICRINESARQAMREMRLFLYELSPIDLENEGLESVLTHRLHAVEDQANIEVDFNFDPKVVLSNDEKVAFYYIAQEALNNVLKHSNADSIKVHVQKKKKYTYLRIQDNGIGFNDKETYKNSMGLGNMKERANDIGASCIIKSQPNEGTLVEIRL